MDINHKLRIDNPCPAGGQAHELQDKDGKSTNIVLVQQIQEKAKGQLNTLISTRGEKKKER